MEEQCHILTLEPILFTACLLLYVFKLRWDSHNIKLTISKCQCQRHCSHPHCCITTYHLAVDTFVIPAKECLYLWSSLSLCMLFPPPRPWKHPCGYNVSRLASSGYVYHIQDVLQYEIFCVWYLLLHTVFRGSSMSQSIFAHCLIHILSIPLCFFSLCKGLLSLGPMICVILHKSGNWFPPSFFLAEFWTQDLLPTLLP